MRKIVLAAALLAAASSQGVSAADRQCYSPADIEAEQAILFQTNVMVISSACKDTVYGEFRARNSDAIIRYQKAMIDHFRRAGSRNARATSIAGIPASPTRYRSSRERFRWRKSASRPPRC